MNTDSSLNVERLQHILEKKISKNFDYKLLQNKNNDQVVLSYNFKNITKELRLYKLDAPLFTDDDMYCFATIRTINEKKALYIDDISGKEKRKGHGTLILNELIAYCENENIGILYGKLGTIDPKEPKEPIIAFYESLGAVCTYDKNIYNGEFVIEI